MAKTRKPKKVRVGEFTISPWPDMYGRPSVYVEQADGEGGTFPKLDIVRAVGRLNPEKALRLYYDKHF